MRYLRVFTCFLLCFMAISYLMIKMNGNLVFRAHKTIDWIIWGIMITSFFAGILFMLMSGKKKSRNKLLVRKRNVRKW